MKKRGHPNIPDFSHARGPSPPAPKAAPKAARPPMPERATVKLQAMSGKSGRRGQ